MENTNNSTNAGSSPTEDADKVKKDELIKTTVERVLSKDNLRVSSCNGEVLLLCIIIIINDDLLERAHPGV